ncbi:MAG: hypothetical protein IJ776_00570 [Paludibacteraceae bacterium]|nr:hypothetical protein [Paludibacteraceae bacterium]
MQRDTLNLKRRNKDIINRVMQLLGTRPIMDIYQQVAYEFYLSEETVRQIFQKR